MIEDLSQREDQTRGDSSSTSDIIRSPGNTSTYQQKTSNKHTHLLGIVYDLTCMTITCNRFVSQTTVLGSTTTLPTWRSRSLQAWGVRGSHPCSSCSKHDRALLQRPGKAPSDQRLRSSAGTSEPSRTKLGPRRASSRTQSRKSRKGGTKTRHQRFPPFNSPWHKGSSGGTVAPTSGERPTGRL
jgi:hypothetical protein